MYTLIHSSKRRDIATASFSYFNDIMLSSGLFRPLESNIHSLTRKHFVFTLVVNAFKISIRLFQREKQPFAFIRRTNAVAPCSLLFTHTLIYLSHSVLSNHFHCWFSCHILTALIFLQHARSQHTYTTM